MSCLSACLVRASNSKTEGQRKTKIRVNFLQGSSNRCVNYQIISLCLHGTIINSTGRTAAYNGGTWRWHIFLLIVYSKMFHSFCQLVMMNCVYWLDRPSFSGPRTPTKLVNWHSLLLVKQRGPFYQYGSNIS